jgi:VIT1/CCC1 family predicted Fe2+/Mn2+ transporter
LAARQAFSACLLLDAPGDLPFFFIVGPSLALRVSNLVAIGMLFLTGYLFGRSTGHRSLLLGCTMVLVGALLTVFAIRLGR